MNVRPSVLGFPVDAGMDTARVLEKLANEPTLLAYLNPLAWSVARRHPAYLADLAAMDLVVCDGVAVQRAVRRFLGVDTPIISLDYSGIARQYLTIFRERGSRVCLVGGQANVVEVARARLLEDFRGLNITGWYPGFGNGPANARDFILESGVEYVLAGMGMGMQERFLLSLRESGWRGGGICVGAFFDRLASPEVDYPAWSVRLNLRFLGNITRRPVYYLKRYGVDYLPFLKQYVAHLLRRDGERGRRKG